MTHTTPPTPAAPATKEIESLRAAKKKQSTWYGQSAEDRFWAKVDKSGECWLWTARVCRKGYGQFKNADNRLVKAHRFSYEIAKGAIAEGVQIDHLCRVHACVNPAHLETVTSAENTARGLAGVPQKKLTTEQVEQAKREHMAGRTIKSLAAEYGVSAGTLQKAISGITWRGATKAQLAYRAKLFAPIAPASPSIHDDIARLRASVG